MPPSGFSRSPDGCQRTDRGQTPVVVRSAPRITQSMISAVGNPGLMRFKLYDGVLNADRFVGLLRRLTKDAGQKVFLIIDNLRVHHAKLVKDWVAAHRHDIELFCLPAGLRPRPQPRRIFEQRPAAEAAPAAAAGIQSRSDQEHPHRAARHPALACLDKGLLQATAGTLRRLNVRCDVGILVLPVTTSPTSLRPCGESSAQIIIDIQHCWTDENNKQGWQYEENHGNSQSRWEARCFLLSAQHALLAKLR